ncbi:cytochrome c oxidase, cbb3-type, subunit II [Maricaulis maris MCS10]|uniref:Cytochrome c oxidase, cbb3-type, subunit II n=1 Tax=Maricaulis maris (strain MCS10) TaxID=394221 RepID=Q0AQJ4_MARMM|nr:cytochrome-c oxidase, cbb3-type subunit II [Maricaulis maris]ABI65443.1 cytochrome c oxidase, cbb3-type, subunit II [Maricaulis maris MCS10]
MSGKKSLWSDLHKSLFEKNSLILTVGVLVTVSIGGIVEIAPLFYLDSTIEEVDGMRPYTPLEQLGRDIYIREGCYNCHSQMVRPLRDEVERYGHYSLAAESMYDHPFQWGSKRTGPDLARVGGKYSDEWHRDHMRRPQSVVPESIMPAYGFLETSELAFDNVEANLRALRTVGVPYDDTMLASAVSDIETQLDPFADDYDGFQARYPGAVMREFDGNPDQVTELDALIAYLQVLGTMVDFSTYEAEADENLR